MRPPVPPLRLLASGALLGLLGGLAVTSAAAQEDCVFAEGSGTLRSITLAGGARITNVGTPHLLCADGVEIWADSAVAFSAQGMTDLIGGVRFVDPTRELRSRTARYFSNTGRLQASGDVYLEDRTQGSVIRNGDLVYLHETDFRDQEQITVTTAADRVRPRATLYMRPEADATAPADSAGAQEPAPPPETADDRGSPYEVVGDRLFLVGDGFFRANGRVEVDRDSLHATADSVEYDQVAGRMALAGQARVRGSTYDLAGRAIDVLIPAGEVREVVARRDGILTGEDLRLTAPFIRVFMQDGLMDRLVATPLRTEEPLLTVEDSLVLERPVALAEAFRLEADSIDALAPAQALERVHAGGAARGESTSRDSLNVEVLPEIARTDWLEGDTVIVTFVRAGATATAEDSLAVVGDSLAVAPPRPPEAMLPGAAPIDTAQTGYTLDRLVAAGSARSLYRLLPSDSTSRPGVDPPAVHYVTGARITISMVAGEVSDMEVEGQTHGYHLEPLRFPARTDTAVVDSATARDTAAVADSLRARPDTGGAAGRPARRAPKPEAPTPEPGPGPTDEPARPESRRER